MTPAEHTPCCEAGRSALASVEAYLPAIDGYTCPVHGWRWVGQAPRCRCGPAEEPCEERADGADGLCRYCRAGHHARPVETKETP